MSQPEIYIVAGMPGAGKTTWVEERRKPGDVVYDMDAIADTMMQCRKYPRPENLQPLLLDIRRAVVRFAATRVATTFIIVSNGGYGGAAAGIAETIGGKLIQL